MVVYLCFFHTGATPTDYNDDHILALQEFLGDILQPNTILPSCSDVIFPAGDMFANFSFELEWKFLWNSTRWRWKPTYKANAMGYLSLHALLISHWQLAEPIAIWCRSQHPCFYPPIVIHSTVNSRVVCILDVYCISQIDKINHHAVFLKSRPHRNVRNVHPQFDHRAEFHVYSHVVYYRRITRWIE